MTGLKTRHGEPRQHRAVSSTERADAAPLTTRLPTAVVVPLDGSPRSRQALPLAHALADAFHATVVTVTVDDGRDRPAADLTLTGNPVEALLDYLDTRPGTLLCMSSHGRTGLGRRLLGSVAEQLIHHSPAPVVVTGPRARRLATPPRAFLAGLAWSPSPDRLVALLASWAPSLHAAVDLVFVRRPSAAALYTEHVTGHGPADQPDLERHALRLLDRGLDVRSVVLTASDPATALNNHADRLAAPVLVAVDSHPGDHDPSHHVTSQLIHIARWPVLATTGRQP